MTTLHITGSAAGTVRDPTPEEYAAWIARHVTPESTGLPPYPEGEVAGPCACGSWPGGKCLRCRVVPNVPLTGASTARGKA